jgi:hypothetical protein
MTRRLLIVTIALVVLSATPALANVQTAPGRVIFSLDGGHNDDLSVGVPGPGPISAVALPDGGALILGGSTEDNWQTLAWVTANGQLDPAHGDGSGIVHVAGLPDDFRGVQVALGVGGRILLVGADPNTDGYYVVAGLTADGAVDPSYGTAGIATTAVADAGTTAPAEPQPDGSLYIDGVSARALVSPSGTVTSADPVVVPSPPPTAPPTAPAFGGGAAQVGVLHHLPLGMPVDVGQSGLSPRVTVMLSDGSLLRVDALELGWGDASTGSFGSGIVDVAVTRFTPAMALDTAFGGPASQLQATVALRSTTRSAVMSSHAVSVNLNLSAPGLAGIDVMAGNHLIAQSTLAALAAGASTSLPSGRAWSRVQLVTSGYRYLRAHRNVHVTISLLARDLLGNGTDARARGTLR